MLKSKENPAGSQKKTFSFPVNLMEDIDEKFCIKQNNCHNTEIYPCDKCVATTFKRFTEYVHEKCCPLIEKNILIEDECNKLYSSEIKLAKHYTRSA